RLRAPIQRLAGPVTEVGVLAKDTTELILAVARDRRHDLAERRPSQPEGAALRGWECAAAHVHRGATEVVVGQRPEVGAEDACLLERGGGCADRGAGPGEIQHGRLS